MVRKQKKKPKLVRKWELEASKETTEKPKRKFPMRDFEHSAEIQHGIDEKFPEFKEDEVPEVEGKKITDFQTSWKESDKETGKSKITVLKEVVNRKIEYTIGKNPLRIFLCNVSSGKIYFDLETEEFWFYVFSKDRNRIIRKIKLENHDILELMAFSLWSVYGAEKLLNPNWCRQIRVTKKMRERIAKIEARDQICRHGSDVSEELALIIAEWLLNESNKHKNKKFFTNDSQKIEVGKP